MMFSRILPRQNLLILLGIFAASIPLTTASAATLERRSLSDLAKGAELIVDGTVIGQKVEALGGGQGARTCFTIAVAEVVAGTSPGKSVRLCFFGGEIGGRGYGVSGMQFPKVGERGIYLIESVHQPMLNPLIGWDQGRFGIVKDAASGALKVTTADGRRVTALTPEAAQPSARATVVSSEAASAAGVVADDGSDLRGAISRDDFVAKLRVYHGG
ncbi:MAG TPA: hypothetical protein VL899_17790 [Alphaproteobacteria bacterium]|nr:hypothetical protein [Alphaproteobacteria bacterium]